MVEYLPGIGSWSSLEIACWYPIQTLFDIFIEIVQA